MTIKQKAKRLAKIKRIYRKKWGEPRKEIEVITSEGANNA
jgi:hypothetical protein